MEKSFFSGYQWVFSISMGFPRRERSTAPIHLLRLSIFISQITLLFRFLKNEEFYPDEGIESITEHCTAIAVYPLSPCPPLTPPHSTSPSSTFPCSIIPYSISMYIQFPLLSPFLNASYISYVSGICDCRPSVSNLIRNYPVSGSRGIFK